MLNEIIKNEAGITTVEYVIILSIIAVGAISAWQRFGASLQFKIVWLSDIINGLGAGIL